MFFSSKRYHKIAAGREESRARKLFLNSGSVHAIFSSDLERRKNPDVQTLQL